MNSMKISQSWNQNLKCMWMSLLIKRIPFKTLFFSITAKEEDSNYFPNSIKFMGPIFVVPLSTALCECRFPSMNWMKTTFHIHLHLKLLDDLLIIKYNRGAIHQLELESAMILWLEKTGNSKIRHCTCKMAFVNILLIKFVLYNIVIW